MSNGNVVIMLSTINNNLIKLSKQMEILNKRLDDKLDKVYKLV